MVPGRLVAHPVEGQEKLRALAFLVLGSGSMCLGSLLLAHILFYPPVPGSPGAGACGRSGKLETRFPVPHLPHYSSVDCLTSVSDAKSLEFILHSPS